MESVTEQNNSPQKTAQDLWRYIFGEERGLLHLLAARREGERLVEPKIAHYNYPGTVEAAEKWALEKSDEGREVFFCAHLLTRPERKKKNAAPVRAQWGDLDGIQLPSGSFAPSGAVETSPGNYHVYWLLEEPIPPEVAEQLNKRLAHKVGADASGFDLTQLLRVPGTKNYKYPETPVVEVLYLTEDGSTYSPRFLDEQLPKVEERRQAPQVERRIASGGRNKELTSIAGTMRRRGLEEEELAAALLTVNERRCDPPLEAEEVRKIARSVAGYEPEDFATFRVNGRNSHSHSPIGNVNVNEPENLSTSYPKRNLRAVSFAGREKPPPQEFVAERILPRGMATSFYGGGGLAKSVNVLHLGMAVAFVGLEEWHGLRIATMPVIYLDFEMAEPVQLRRAKEIADGSEWPDIPKGFHYVEAAGYPTADVFGFALELLEEHGPALVIVDSFGFSMQGESERSADVLAYVRNYIQPLQDEGGTLLVVDHIARAIKGERAADKEAFGSVYKTNSMRSTINVTGHTDEDAGVVYATFTHRKSNVGPKLKPFTVVTRFTSETITFERSETVIHPPTEDTIEQLIVAAIREHGPMTNKQIAADIDRDLRSVQNATSRLKRAGALEETGEKIDREAVLDVVGL